MLANEAGNEVVAVVVAWAQIQRERVPRLVAGFAQQVGLKLALQELVAQALINQQRQTLLHGANQLHGVVLLPHFPIAAQVRLEGLVPPGNLGGGDDGREGRDASITARSEEHTSELPALMRISYAVFCLKKTTKPHTQTT